MRERGWGSGSGEARSGWESGEAGDGLGEASKELMKASISWSEFCFDVEDPAALLLGLPKIRCRCSSVRAKLRSSLLLDGVAGGGLSPAGDEDHSQPILCGFWGAWVVCL